MSEIIDYQQPRTVEQACQCLEQPGTRVLAGGTDLLLRVGRMKDPVKVVDITALSELSGIRREAGCIRIGALTHLADVARAQEFQHPAFQALVLGAVQVGSPQIRNLATLGGNLCNAAPSADTAAPLLALDAQAEITSRQGTRTLPLTSFFLGPGKTVLAPGELLTALVIPTPEKWRCSTYIKHSPRRAMDLAFVGVAVALQEAGQTPVSIALSAVAPTPIRVPAAEALLAQSGSRTEAVLEQAASLSEATARPISDIRCSAAYRTAMVKALTLRALRQVLAC